jgi:hypothetical protein
MSAEGSRARGEFARRDPLGGDLIIVGNVCRDLVNARPGEGVISRRAIGC